MTPLKRTCRSKRKWWGKLQNILEWVIMKMLVHIKTYEMYLKKCLPGNLGYKMLIIWKVDSSKNQ